VPWFVKAQKVFDDAEVGFFGMVAVVLEAQNFSRFGVKFFG
jgi:hypothetical protein